MPRDPYPFPKLQNDTDFAGNQPKQVRKEFFLKFFYHEGSEAVIK